MTVRMIAPTPYAPFQTGSGTRYVADANGVILAQSGDVLDLLDALCTMAGGSAGAGSVQVWGNAGVPTNGTTGTLAGETSPGDPLVDSINKTLYQNTNTSLSPTWTQLTALGGAGAYTGTFNGILGGITPAAATVTGLTSSGYIKGSTSASLTAVGTSRADALQLAAEYNLIGAAASTAVGTILPVGVVGMAIDVNLLNAVTAASIHVYASGSETIDTIAGATGVLLTKNKACRYKFVAALTWVSMLWGGPSA
jgi:hypothetical protein